MAIDPLIHDPGSRQPVHRAAGVTPTERYLTSLCHRSFLSLWSYPNIFRDQDGGKEVCDLLAVFGDDILVFSDKQCTYPSGSDPELNWTRWFRRCIQSSAEQAWAAERWIASHPDRLFLDPTCRQRFPLPIPGSGSARFHRIVIAHGAARQSRSVLGGSGSLMLLPSLDGPGHLRANRHPLGRIVPFMVGDLDSRRGLVHVLDDATLERVLQTLDTVADFVDYLAWKTEFWRGGSLAFAAGEEELLAYYLQTDEPASASPSTSRGAPRQQVSISEGWWKTLIESQAWQHYLVRARSSCAWDDLIQRLSKSILDASSYVQPTTNISSQERALRFMAAETRSSRISIVERYRDFLARSAPSKVGLLRIVRQDPQPELPGYVFLLVPRNADFTPKIPTQSAPWQTQGDPAPAYRQVRSRALAAACMIAKTRWPQVRYFVGVASEPGLEQYSEDVGAFDFSQWTSEQQAQAVEFRQHFPFLDNQA